MNKKERKEIVELCNSKVREEIKKHDSFREYMYESIDMFQESLYGVRKKQESIAIAYAYRFLDMALELMEYALDNFDHKDKAKTIRELRDKFRKENPYY